MTDLRFHWVDAFSARPFAGNGCMVVHDAGGLDAETCMGLVRETSLTECTFLEASDVADVKVRYFLADREIGFAGHPTLASVLAWAEAAGRGEGEFMLETGAGLIPVRLAERDGRAEVTMRQNAPVFGVEADPTEVAAIYGLATQDIIGTPQVVSVGLGHTITVLRDIAALRRARVDYDRLHAFCARHPSPDGGPADPYLIAREGATPNGNTFARLFVESGTPVEDPFTGSATGEAAAYLWARGLVERPVYTAEQGHDLGRPGTARVRVLGEPSAIEGIEITGSGAILMRGTLAL
ncbi:MAG: PhzF family phenazine biosynthesis protein [Paracoccaceae bacterium]|nr:PhzF family phenazine biosynthesis protein [Paracoccaceae bacterium]